MTRLLHGDNLLALRQLEGEGVVVDLAYLDPPFLTNETFRMKDGRVAFDDRWPDRSTYMAELAKRLVIIHRLLAPHASLVIHVDPRVSHYVKVWCDDTFGADAFTSEVIWRYRHWPVKAPRFQRVHDILLHYRKDPSVSGRWNQLHEPPAESTLRRWGRKRQISEHSDGRRGRTVATSEETPGALLGDVWEIGNIAPVAKERTGYPTQKPEALLSRVVSALSNPGDLILDSYVGSGTTLAVAVRLGRRAIGIDASEVAIEIASKRLGIASIERVAG